MNYQRLFRKVHYWLSLAVFIPCGVVFVTGTLLLLKKDIAWIQPETQMGAASDTAPTASYDALLAAAAAQPNLNVTSWADIKRVDIRPAKGIAKVRSETGWEVQVDTETGEAIQTAFRRSDIIESIHDGSFFSDEVKYFVFLPTSLLLITMWLTGIYLFLLPQVRKIRRAVSRSRSADAS